MHLDGVGTECYKETHGHIPNPKYQDCMSSGVRESVNKSAASAASPDYVKFQAVIKSAASAASLRGGALAADCITAFFLQFLAAPLAAKNSQNLGLCCMRPFNLATHTYLDPGCVRGTEDVESLT